MYRYWLFVDIHIAVDIHNLCLLFFPLLFLRGALIALEKNLMFLIYGQNKRNDQNGH